MKKQKIKTWIATKSVASINVHPLFLKYKGIELTDQLLSEVKKYGSIDVPIITKDNFALTNGEKIEAAKKTGVTTHINVVVVDLDATEVPRLFQYLNFTESKTKMVMISNYIDFLEDHLGNSIEGKAWAAEFGGQNTRQIIGKLINVSESYVSRIKKIAEFNSKSFEHIDGGIMTIHQAYKEACTIENKLQAEYKASNVYGGNVLNAKYNSTNTGKTDQLIDGLNLSLSIGVFDIKLEEGNISSTLNGNKNTVHYNYVEDKKTENNKGCITHIITLDKGTIQITIEGELNDLIIPNKLKIAA